MEGAVAAEGHLYRRTSVAAVGARIARPRREAASRGGYGGCGKPFVSRHNPSVMAKPCPRVATWPSRPALRSAKESGCWAAAVAYSATGSAPLRASPQGEAWGAAFDEGALADQASGPMWASAPTRERRRRSGVAARRAADSRPYGEIGVGVAQRRKKDAVSSETASFLLISAV